MYKCTGTLAQDTYLCVCVRARPHALTIEQRPRLLRKAKLKSMFMVRVSGHAIAEVSNCLLYEVHVPLLGNTHPVARADY